MRRCTRAARAVITGLTAVAVATVAGAQQRRALPGHVPAAAARIAAIDRLPAAQSLNLAIGLPLRNPEALARFLRDLYDPASPNYRHYLTSEQFTEKFGPAAADYQAVVAFAQANGLTVTGTHADRMLLDVCGPVTAVEHAFRLALRVYPHPAEARTFFAPDAEPSVEAALPIQDISGLSDFRLPRPKLTSGSRRLTPTARKRRPWGPARMGCLWARITARPMPRGSPWTARANPLACLSSTATTPVTSPNTKAWLACRMCPCKSFCSTGSTVCPPRSQQWQPRSRVGH